MPNPEDTKTQEPNQEPNQDPSTNPSTNPSTDPNQEPTNEPKKEELYKIKVDGKEMELTRDEIIERAQKGTSAERKMQKASELVEESRTSNRAKELVSKITTTGRGLPRNEARELADIVGGTEDYFMDRPEPTSNQANQQTNQQTPNNNLETPQPDPNNPGGEPKKLTLEDLPEELQDVVREAKKRKNTDQVEEIKNNLRNILDSDSETDKIVDRYPEDKRDAIKEELFDLAFKEVSLGILSGRQKFGPDLMKTAVQKARSLAKQLGIQGVGASHSDKLSGIISGLGPSSDMSIPREGDGKPIERVESSDGNYASNFMQRLAQKLKS